jgi:hypothetical protein
MPPTMTQASFSYSERLTQLQVRRRVFITVLALALATLLAAVAIPVGRHLVTAWWLESLHGMVQWEMDETNWRQGGVTSVSFAARNWWNVKLSNGELKYLWNLHRVVSLDLAEKDGITTKGLAALRGLEFLSELNLARLDRYRPDRLGNLVPFTDACLVHLQALPRLEKLGLAGNQITDQGLAQLAKMSKLKTLDLSATEVTDAGLIHLQGMKSLGAVNLGATRVTKEGLTILQTARPDLLIELDTEPAVEEAVKLRRGATS